jgi:hypothetical protein
MWGVVLVLALSASADPLRLGFTLLLMSRPRPMLNLLAFWLGGMTAGIGVAMAALILLRDTALVAIHNVESTIENVRSTVAIFTGGRLQITLGLLALLFAAGLSVRERVQVPIRGGDASALALQPGTPTAFSRLSARVQGMLECGFVCAAFVVGLGQATPPVDTALALAVIMASGAAIGVQVSAFVAFTVEVLAVIEIALVSYLIAPNKTEAVMLQLQNWIRTRRRRISITMLAVAGALFVVKGIGSL